VLRVVPHRASLGRGWANSGHGVIGFNVIIGIYVIMVSGGTE
jgi:hypothetical protein